jgi:hypothetical protein
VFVTADNLEEMVRSSHWFMDGTFKTTPPLLAQVYTIHILKQGQALPVVFTLLPDKTASTYERLFRCLVQSKPELQPVSVMTDFEAAARKPDSKIQRGLNLQKSDFEVKVLFNRAR